MAEVQHTFVEMYVAELKAISDVEKRLANAAAAANAMFADALDEAKTLGALQERQRVEAVLIQQRALHGGDGAVAAVLDRVTRLVDGTKG